MSLLGPEPNTKKDAEFILGLVGKTYAHQLQPFFRGTVISSTPVGPGQLGYLVKVQRPEGTAPDGMEYLCLIPGYVPAAGDVVDCMWRDARTGYVFAVLQASRGFMPYRARATGGSQFPIAVSATPTICHLNSLTYDPNNNFNPATYQYTAPVSGDYLIIGQAQWSLSGTALGRLYAQIFIAGVGSSAGTPPDTGTNGVTSDVEDELPLTAGQTVDLRVAHDRTTAQTLYGSRLAIRQTG